MDPVRAVSGIPYFYSVDETLTPSLDEIERLMLRESPDILLVVHYFGFVRLDMQRIRQICDRQDVVLVEDCAHVGLFSSSTGKVGDFSFYSLHKLFAVESGGVLRSNRQDNRNIYVTPEEKCSTQVLEQVLRSDVQSMARIRQENYEFLDQAFNLNKGIEPLWKLGPSCVPHSFPVLVGNGLREKLYFHLQAQNLPIIALYYQLADELKPESFPISFALSNSILNLPVHQDVTIPDLKIMVAEIEAFFG